MRLIDADKLKAELDDIANHSAIAQQQLIPICHFKKVIDRIPTVEEIDNKQGGWVYREEWFEDEEKPRMAWGCNLCGHSIKSIHEKLNFCPNCGADMRGREE